VVSALKKWLDEYPADFDVYMLEQLNEWLNQKVDHAIPPISRVFANHVPIRPQKDRLRPRVEKHWRRACARYSTNRRMMTYGECIDHPLSLSLILPHIGPATYNDYDEPKASSRTANQ
jgi:hypothetical protein